MRGLPICRAHGALPLFLGGFAFAALLSVCDGGPRPPVSMDAEMGQRIRAYSVGIGYQAGQELRATGMLTPYAGIILTNDHAIPGAKSTKITLDGKEFHEARVIARNAELDLALLKVENGEFSAELPELATSPRAGMPVVAFGSAFGLHRSFLQGYVSHERRVGLRGQTKGTHYIQVQSITFPGMSGFHFARRMDRHQSRRLRLHNDYGNRTSHPGLQGSPMDGRNSAGKTVNHEKTGTYEARQSGLAYGGQPQCKITGMTVDAKDHTSVARIATSRTESPSERFTIRTPTVLRPMLEISLAARRMA